jgi:hypothetical protein
MRRGHEFPLSTRKDASFRLWGDRLNADVIIVNGQIYSISGHYKLWMACPRRPLSLVRGQARWIRKRCPPPPGMSGAQRSAPVRSLDKLTVALAGTAPLGSVIFPRIVPALPRD